MKLKDLIKKMDQNTIVNLVETDCTYLGATKASCIGHGTEYKNIAKGMNNPTIPCSDNRIVEKWHSAEEWHSMGYNVIYVFLKAEKEAK